VPGIHPRKVQVRRLDARDLDACLDLAEDRSWARESAKWRLLLELGGGYGIDGDGGLVGTVFLTEVARGMGVVGMLLVARRQGGCGLGRLLMEEALRAAGGASVFLYATEAGRPLYAKLGFRVVDTVTAYVGSYRQAGGSPRVRDLRTAGGGGLAALARLDRQAFGADRGTLLRYLFGFAERVVITAGGYAAAWRNLGAVHAGPLVADSVSTAKALLDAVFPEGTATARVDLHSHAAGALGGWLAARGLTARPPAPLMVRGQDLPGNRAMLLSPLMQALG
jgi:GNAT superfamily N-acetyltransferase